MKIFRKVLFTGGAALVLTAMTGGVAHADGTAIYSAVSPDGGSQASFASEGELFSVHDRQCDGMAARVQYKKGTSGSVTTLETRGGCGSRADANESYTEGAVIYFRACTAGGTGGVCSDWKRATA